MFLRFTTPARRVLAHANAAALAHGSAHIGTEHLLAGIARAGGAGSDVLSGVGLTPAGLDAEINKMGLGTAAATTAAAKLPMAPSADRAVRAGIDVTRIGRRPCVNTADLLAGLTREDRTVAAQILLNLGLSPDAIREAALARSATATEEWASPLWAGPKP